MRVRSLSLLSIILLGLSLTGCHSDGADGGPDMTFLRTPDIDAEKTATIQEPTSLLFPSGSMRQWKMAVRTPQATTEETIRVDSRRPAEATAKDTVLTMYQGGKPYRSEIYRVDANSILLVAEGGTNKMVMSPPMPLINVKTPEGVDFKWEGKIHFKGATAPAVAYSRIHSPQEMVTPAGKFMAYRVDTVLTTIIQGRAFTFPASRWFAPGVGIIKQAFQIQSVTVEKNLISYSGG